MKLWKKNLIILFLVVMITVLPLVLLKNAYFAGADNKAEATITEIDSNYKPWISSFFKPSSETESMLFALQAAIGGGIIGFGFGRLSAKNKKDDD